MTFLPDFMSFGSTTNRFGTVVQLQPVSAETALPATGGEAPPLGVDLGFDFGSGDFMFTRGGDLILVNEESSFEQWLTNALITTRNQDIIYDYRFGSQITDLLGIGQVIDAVISEAVRYISEAIMIHDRVASVENFTYYFAANGSESIVFSFDVVTDEAARFQFGGLQVG